MGQIDLNLDAGEMESRLADGSEEKMFALVSSVNVACGGHAGTRETMSQALRLAKRYGLRVGAHPSFPDRKNFGRRPVQMDLLTLQQSLQEQIRALMAVAKTEGMELTHVKPHGALYNQVVEDHSLAQCLLTAVQSVDSSLQVMGLAGSKFLTWCEQAGLAPLAEAFCDRVYETEGRLRSRDQSDAVITDPERAAAQAVEIVVREQVITFSQQPRALLAQTLCIHGDTPNALEVLQAVRRALAQARVSIVSYR